MEERKKPGPKPGFKKNANKQIREPVGEEVTVHKLSKADKIRMATGKQLKLDVSFYANLPEYRDKQLFWAHKEDGDVEKWLHLGADLVPRRSKAPLKYEGFTTHAESEWECRPVGVDGNGGRLTAYLMVMNADEYEEIKVAPNRARNQEILKALGIGKDQAGERVMPQVKGLKTYAPNLPTGGKGFEQTHDV